MHVSSTYLDLAPGSQTELGVRGSPAAAVGELLAPEPVDAGPAAPVLAVDGRPVPGPVGGVPAVVVAAVEAPAADPGQDVADSDQRQPEAGAGHTALVAVAHTVEVAGP